MKKLIVLSLVALLAVMAGTASAASTSRKTYIDNCGKKAFRPAKIVIACADGNYYLNTLKWAHWGNRRATATGLAWINLCKPNCAKGKFKSYPITAKASRRSPCKGHRVYKRLAVTFTHAVPKGYSNPDRIKLGCV